MPPIKDRTFHRYGKLVVTAECGRTAQLEALWLCICDCGNYTIRSAGTIRHGIREKYIANCGCEKKNDVVVDSNSGRHLCSKCKQYPMTPWYQQLKPTSGLCSRCVKTYGVSNRSKRWESGERPVCRNHPFTFVNKCFWIHKGTKQCAKCVRDSRSVEYNKRHDKRKYISRRDDPNYKEYMKCYDSYRRKTKKLRNYGN